MNKKRLITAITVLILAGGVGFYGGIKYQQSKIPTGRQTGLTRQFGNNSSFRPVNGQVLSTGNNSITVKIQDGSSKIIILTDKTQINQATQATVTDLKVGSTVVVIGLTNSDGSVTAQSVQLNPIARGTNPPQGQ